MSSKLTQRHAIYICYAPLWPWERSYFWQAPLWPWDIFLDIMNPKWTLTNQRCSLATGCKIIYRILNLCVGPYFVKGSRWPAGCGGYVQDFFWYVLYQVGEPMNSWKTHGCILCIMPTGGWFNIKMSSYQYRKSHCGDKTILRPSYLHNGISYTGKMTSLYWIGVLVSWGECTSSSVTTMLTKLSLYWSSFLQKYHIHKEKCLRVDNCYLKDVKLILTEIKRY